MFLEMTYTCRVKSVAGAVRYMAEAYSKLIEVLLETELNLNGNHFTLQSYFFGFLFLKGLLRNLEIIHRTGTGQIKISLEPINQFHWR